MDYTLHNLAKAKRCTRRKRHKAIKFYIRFTRPGREYRHLGRNIVDIKYPTDY